MKPVFNVMTPGALFVSSFSFPGCSFLVYIRTATGSNPAVACVHLLSEGFIAMQNATNAIYVKCIECVRGCVPQMC